jgi:hypothetical protein
VLGDNWTCNATYEGQTISVPVTVTKVSDTNIPSISSLESVENNLCLYGDENIIVVSNAKLVDQQHTYPTGESDTNYYMWQANAENDGNIRPIIYNFIKTV